MMKTIAAVLLAVFACLGAQPAIASWTETFTGGFDVPGWVFSDDSANSPPDATAVTPSGGTLPITYIPAQLGLGNFDTFVGGVVPTDIFTDVRVRATVSPLGTTPDINSGAGNANNDVFISARVNGAGTSAYLLVWDYGVRYLNLVRVDSGTIVVPQNTVEQPNVSTTVNGTDLTASYVLELDAIANTLTGRLFAADGVTQLAEITWQDNTYASGAAGIGVAMNDDLSPPNGNTATFLNTGFDNVSAIAIPEPTTATLALWGFAALTLRRRRR